MRVPILHCRDSIRHNIYCALCTRRLYNVEVADHAHKLCMNKVLLASPCGTTWIVPRQKQIHEQSSAHRQGLCKTNVWYQEGNIIINCQKCINEDKLSLFPSEAERRQMVTSCPISETHNLPAFTRVEALTRIESIKRDFNKHCSFVHSTIKTSDPVGITLFAAGKTYTFNFTYPIVMDENNLSAGISGSDGQPQLRVLVGEADEPYVDVEDLL